MDDVIKEISYSITQYLVSVTYREGIKTWDGIFRKPESDRLTIVAEAMTDDFVVPVICERLLKYSIVDRVVLTGELYAIMSEILTRIKEDVWLLQDPEKKNIIDLVREITRTIELNRECIPKQIFVEEVSWARRVFMELSDLI